MTSTIEVSAGIIVKNNKVLAARRKPGLHLAGLWEFPGGKVEPNETPESCLVRELKEEFGIDTRIVNYVGDNYHAYESKTIHLMAFQVEHLSGQIQLNDHDQIKWLSIEELDSLNWAEADIPLIQSFKSIISLTEFYQQFAQPYADETQPIDMKDLYPKFLNLLPTNAHILDLGCGAGRDSAHFIDLGFTVTALDGSANLAKIAEKHINQPVQVKLFQELDFNNQFNGVWACASLLHCPKSQILDVLKKIQHSLISQGILYASFKSGKDESCDARGRFFNNYTTCQLTSLFKQQAGFEIIDCWEESKPLRNSVQVWVNILCRKVAI